ncbi:MAG: serine hydrolase [Calditrichaeota bacterium]|nr:serine hydrolase [Calditrichota bacterium]HQU73729.1 serine hydrolase [Calditrichia bacterium]
MKYLSPHSLIVILAISLWGCRLVDPAPVDYTPIARGDLPISTPGDQGLDSNVVGRLYAEAGELETLYGLLVLKNGFLVAEQYFNEGGIDQLSGRQSATKSVTSALVGIALREGFLESPDQKMIDFFPDVAPQVQDPRKRDITLRQLLEMRGGYPWEELEPPWFDVLFFSQEWPEWQWLPHLADVPLTSPPGSAFKYSNLTSYLLGVAVQRASQTRLDSLGKKFIFEPIGANLAQWTDDVNNYNWGHWEIYLTARDMAKFGLLYLNDGVWNGEQIVPKAWVEASLRRYSEGINFTGWFSSKLGKYFRDLGYGYQWWSATAGDHYFDFAWGHGGQLIVLVDDLDMMVVTTADPLYYKPGEAGWKYEGAIINLVGKFIASIPGD